MAGKMRSPNYPALTLPQALEAASKLWEAEKRTPVSSETAAKSMGYKSLSGPARVAIGAMRQYGLVDKTEKGHLRLSDLAVRALHADGEELLQARIEAAQKPALFMELSETHSDASENAIRSYLITKKGFAEDGARKAARTFREALGLVQPQPPGYTGGDSQEKPQAMHGTETVQNTGGGGGRPQGEVERVRVSLKGGRLARLLFSGDVPTQADIDKVIASLQLQKDSFPEES